jgi:hypothetical protein
MKRTRVKTGVKPNTILRSLIISWGWPPEFVERAYGNDEMVRITSINDGFDSREIGCVEISDSKIFMILGDQDSHTGARFDISTEESLDRAKRFFIKHMTKCLTVRNKNLAMRIRDNAEIISEHNEAIRSMSRRLDEHKRPPKDSH